MNCVCTELFNSLIFIPSASTKLGSKRAISRPILAERRERQMGPQAVVDKLVKDFEFRRRTTACTEEDESRSEGVGQRSQSDSQSPQLQTIQSGKYGFPSAHMPIRITNGFNASWSKKDQRTNQCYGWQCNRDFSTSPSSLVSIGAL